MKGNPHFNFNKLYLLPFLCVSCPILVFNNILDIVVSCRGILEEFPSLSLLQPPTHYDHHCDVDYLTSEGTSYLSILSHSSNQVHLEEKYTKSKIMEDKHWPNFGAK